MSLESVDVIKRSLLPVDVRLAMTESELSGVIVKLRRLLAAAVLKRSDITRESRKHLSTPPLRSCVTTPPKSPNRQLTTASSKSRDIEFPSSPSWKDDTYLTCSDLAKTSSGFRSISTFFDSPSSKLSPLHVRASPSVISRLNLKLNTQSKSALSLLSLSTHPAKQEDSEEIRENLSTVVHELKCKVREDKIAEDRRVRDFKYNPKQVLTEYSGFGMKVRNTRGIAEPVHVGDPAKELSALVEIIDTQLSTSEALGLLHELGIDYQPRTAAGRKNAMATDLSQALAPNGLKLATTPGTDTQPPSRPASRGNSRASVRYVGPH